MVRKITILWWKLFIWHVYKEEQHPYRTVTGQQAACHQNRHKVLINEEYYKCMSSHWNWDAPTPFLAWECASTPKTKGVGWHTCLRVRGCGSPNSDDWRESLAFCLLCEYRCHAIFWGAQKHQGPVEAERERPRNIFILCQSTSRTRNFSFGTCIKRSSIHIAQ